MKPIDLALVVVLGCAGMARTDSLSGRLLNPDSTGRPGVVVSLAGSNLSSITGADGSWSIQRTTSIREAGAGHSTKVGPHLVVTSGRLGLSLDGRDAFGRSSGVGMANILPFQPLARFEAVDPDTLFYLWNGRIILRDTVPKTATAPMVRTFDTTISTNAIYGYIADSQQRQYRTVKIGTQVWMAQNLGVAVDSSWCNGDSAANCRRYGRLYKWSTAMALPDTCDTTDCSRLVGTAPRQGLCPAGWHLPTDSEWTVLATFPTDSARGRLSTATGWSNSGNGKDQFGLALQPGGIKSFTQSPPSYGRPGLTGVYWSASEQYVPRPPEGAIIQGLASCLFVSYDAADLELSYWSDGVYANSLRCLRN